MYQVHIFKFSFIFFQWFVYIGKQKRTEPSIHIIPWKSLVHHINLRVKYKNFKSRLQLKLLKCSSICTKCQKKFCLSPIISFMLICCIAWQIKMWVIMGFRSSFRWVIQVPLLFLFMLWKPYCKVSGEQLQYIVHTAHIYYIYFKMSLAARN